MTAPDWHSVIPEEAVGFVYSPSVAVWFKPTSAGLVGHDGVVIDLSSVFHVRAFTESLDLAWEKSGEEWVFRRLVPAEHDWTSTSRAKLWGAVQATKAGWSYLHEDRITGFWVPFGEASIGDRLAVGLCELRDQDEFGNVYVADTAITRIEVFDG